MTPHRAYRLLLLLAVAGLPSSQACADEAHGLVTIGVQRAFEDVKPAYAAASGLKLNVEFARRFLDHVACGRRPSDQGRESGSREQLRRCPVVDRARCARRPSKARHLYR